MSEIHELSPSEISQKNIELVNAALSADKEVADMYAEASVYNREFGGEDESFEDFTDGGASEAKADEARVELKQFYDGNKDVLHQEALDDAEQERITTLLSIYGQMLILERQAHDAYRAIDENDWGESGKAPEIIMLFHEISDLLKQFQETHKDLIAKYSDVVFRVQQEISDGYQVKSKE